MRETGSSRIDWRAGVRAPPREPVRCNVLRTANVRHDRGQMRTRRRNRKSEARRTCCPSQTRIPYSARCSSTRLSNSRSMSDFVYTSRMAAALHNEASGHHNPQGRQDARQSQDSEGAEGQPRPSPANAETTGVARWAPTRKVRRGWPADSRSVPVRRAMDGPRVRRLVTAKGETSRLGAHDSPPDFPSPGIPLPIVVPRGKLCNKKMEEHAPPPLRINLAHRDNG